ncbi:MAG: hypothetical protein Harvfovirus9_11 [Harvfovirus sp.]|uniref:Uncharacterized protein n=1 Tax=Harvfovirus sp. TaxID=2487768 RepID=A0A3G5A3U9_9VIRU|nr:MAG: hypothetical protein Harvfovirus9_11 [Harvfovirus sp.]
MKAIFFFLLFAGFVSGNIYNIDFYQTGSYDYSTNIVQAEPLENVMVRMNEWINETFNGTIINFETLMVDAESVWGSGVPGVWLVESYFMLSIRRMWYSGETAYSDNPGGIYDQSKFIVINNAFKTASIISAIILPVVSVIFI